MKCKKCGFESKTPLGTALNSAKPGQTVRIKINYNGWLFLAHKMNCLGERVDEVE